MFFHKDLTEAHSAKVDTLVTKKILLARIEKYPDVPNSVAELSVYSNEGKRHYTDIAGKYNENNEIEFRFGKPKGQILIDNGDYARWILSSEFPEDTKAIISQILNKNK